MRRNYKKAAGKKLLHSVCKVAGAVAEPDCNEVWDGARMLGQGQEPELRDTTQNLPTARSIFLFTLLGELHSVEKKQVRREKTPY